MPNNFVLHQYSHISVLVPSTTKCQDWMTVTVAVHTPVRCAAGNRLDSADKLENRLQYAIH